MKKTFYEILWEMCEHEGLTSKWKQEKLLLENDSRIVWSPKVEEIIGEGFIPVGGLPKPESEPTVLPKLKKKEPEADIEWVPEFIAKFSAKQIGVTGKTNGVDTVQAKMKKFLTKYKFTKEEIMGATDLYIDSLRKKGSIMYIRECGYFISKKIDGIDQSDLAHWCQQFRDNGNQSGLYTSRNLI